MLSDQGAFYADAQPTQFKAGLFHVVTGSYDYPAAHVTCARRVHQQGAGRRRVPLLVPHHRGVVPHRAAGADRGLRAGHRSRRDAVQELHPARAVPVRRRRPASCTTPATTPPRCARRSTRSATRRCAPSSWRRAPRAGCIGIGIAHFTEAVGAGPSKKYDIARPEDDRLRRAARAPDRQGDPQARA